ncbi:MAG TPA: CHAD domain-containing protein [Ktedonobacterales bacterium]
MEVEAKFAIHGAMDPQQVSSLTLAPYTLRATGVEQHSDLLLDTSSRAITGALRALRIRTIGEKRILTLKGPNQGAEGVHEREELEASLTGPLSFDPKDWPPEIGEQVAALIGGEPLTPLLRVRVERRLWSVRRSGREIGELALDTGKILAAGRSEPLHELELELKGTGARSDLDALSARLREALPLTPESRSKLERGLALLRHARWSLDGYTPLEAVARHVIRRNLRAMRLSQRLVVEQGDVDGIHDMRVATRRIRTTLQAFEGAGVFRDKTLMSLRRRLKKVADELGQTRDLDIFLKHVRDWVGSDMKREADLTILRDLLGERRKGGYEQLVTQLGKKKHARLVDDLERFVCEPPPLPVGQPCPLTRHYAGSAIWPRYETILRYETIIADAEPPTLHQLRIACKRLRYVLEIFAPQLGDGAKPMRKALVAAQSHLGDIQDLTVALRLVSRLAQSDPGNEGMRAFEQSLQQERQELIAEIGSIWAPLNSAEARAALTGAIVAL